MRDVETSDAASLVSCSLVMSSDVVAVVVGLKVADAAQANKEIGGRRLSQPSSPVLPIPLSTQVVWRLLNSRSRRRRLRLGFSV